MIEWINEWVERRNKRANEKGQQIKDYIEFIDK